MLLVVNLPKLLIPAVGIDQPRLIEAVPAHHAADGVGDQAFDVFFAVGASKRDLLVGNVGLQLGIQSE